jgi:hypothetical protein
MPLHMGHLVIVTDEGLFHFRPAASVRVRGRPYWSLNACTAESVLRSGQSSCVVNECSGNARGSSSPAHPTDAHQVLCSATAPATPAAAWMRAKLALCWTNRFSGMARRSTLSRRGSVRTQTYRLLHVNRVLVLVFGDAPTARRMSVAGRRARPG